MGLLFKPSQAIRKIEEDGEEGTTIFYNFLLSSKGPTKMLGVTFHWDKQHFDNEQTQYKFAGCNFWQQNELVRPNYKKKFRSKESPTWNYRDKISVYGEHPEAGWNTQPFDEINKVMCNM